MDAALTTQIIRCLHNVVESGLGVKDRHVRWGIAYQGSQMDDFTSKIEYAA